MLLIRMRSLNLLNGVNEQGAIGSDAFVAGKGHPIVFWPGWINNSARYSVNPDIYPLPVQPVHHQTWPATQVQLSNGWQQTNYGKRMSYDDYLRLLYSSTSSPRAPVPMPGQKLQPQGNALPSRLQLQNAIGASTPQDNGQLGTGILGPGVNLNGRRYYG